MGKLTIGPRPACRPNRREKRGGPAGAPWIARVATLASVALVASESLINAAALSLVCVRSGAGQTVEIADPSGAPAGACDDAGTITSTDGEVVLRAPFGWAQVAGRARAMGTDAYIAASWPDGRPLGWVRVTRYAATPRSQRATLALQDAAGAAVGTLEPADDDEHLAITAADGSSLARMTLTGSDRGLRRSTMTFAYEATAGARDDSAALALVAALRYRKLLTEALAQATFEGRTR